MPKGWPGTGPGPQVAIDALLREAAEERRHSVGPSPWGGGPRPRDSAPCAAAGPGQDAEGEGEVELSVVSSVSSRARSSGESTASQIASVRSSASAPLLPEVLAAAAIVARREGALSLSAPAEHSLGFSLI